MQNAVDQLAGFNKKFGYPENTRMLGERLTPVEIKLLDEAAIDTTHQAENFLELYEANESDDRKPTCLIRAHLMLEELSETLSALAEGDDEALADGLADLAYVVIGTANTYGIPLDRVFDEVHRSNMTKPVTGAARGRKGEGYEPPKIKEAILEGRKERGWDK